VVALQDEVENVADTVCPDGHDAITCNEELPADEVQVLVRPAARIVDRVTGTLSHSGRYYLVLLDCADREICASTEHYAWDDALKLAGIFKGKDANRARDWWRRKAL